MRTHLSNIATGLYDWARSTPDRVAITDESGEITFEELDSLAGTLARELVERVGDARRDPIPVIVGRDRWSVVGIHGAFRAGVPFAPIDGNLPPRVVGELVARLGGPDVGVVANPELAGKLPELVVPVVVPRVVDDPLDPQPVDPDEVGIVVFTSGSTGQPKGVMRTWPSYLGGGTPRVVRSLENVRVGVTASLHWGAGFAGATSVCLGSSSAIADAAIGNPLALLEWFDREQVTSLMIQPSLVAQLAGRWPTSRRLESVTSVRLFGEAPYWEHVAALRALVHPDCAIQGGFGATEGGHMTEFSIGRDDPIGSGPLPLGLPAGGGHVRLEPLGGDDGESGLVEIVALGDVALGYLGDPELTAVRFGTDADGTRWWRSGDLARVDETGCLWHAGRLDEMVKINGKLVEPAEPERVLRSLPGVRDVVVLPHEGEHGTRLVAHLVVDEGAGLTPDGVRAHLADRLPAHLVPSPLVRHDALPVTTSLKVDRARLRSEELHPWRVAPVAATWIEFERWCLHEVRRILGFDDVGPRDDLFAMGMDSLGAMELCAAISDAGFGEFDPSQLLLARTVTGIREHLARTATPDPSTVVVLNAGGTRPPLFALPGAGSTALRYRYLAAALGDDRPVVVIEPRGMHKPGPPDRTVERMAVHVSTEIEARLGPDDPCLLLGYSGSGPVAYDAARRLDATGRRVHLILLDTAPTQHGDPAVRAAAPNRPVAVRHASMTELPGAVLRSVQFRWRHRDATLQVCASGWTEWRLERFPGRPRFDADRYAAFARIMVKAGTSYRPDPIAVPATLVHVGVEEFVDRCAELIPDLAVHQVGGTHYTMLEPPEVARLAVVIAGVADSSFTAAPAR